MKTLFKLTYSILFIFTILCSTSALAGQNILYYFSEPNDYIGQGAEVSFTSTDGSFTLDSTSNGVSINFISPGYIHWWYLSMSAADGAVLQPGAYENAERNAFKSVGHPGLDFSGEGRGCSSLSGRFDVLQLVLDASGNITQFAANFEQHCEGGPAALYGQIRFNSDVPLSGKPIHITLNNLLNGQGCVEAADPKGATVTVEALGIADAQGGNALDYNWSTTNGQIRSGSTFSFLASLSQDLTQPVIVNLTVTDLTNNSQKSVTKSICVSDTMPPSIVINHPKPGEVVRGDNLVLDVSITDATDKNIDKYEVHVGSNFISPINPKTGQSRQRIFDAPKADGTITVTITVKAHDSTGNTGQQSVTVSQIPAKRK